MQSLPEHIAKLIRDGRKIEAIKLLREETGVDLKTAKEAVDKLDADPAFDPVSLDEAIANASGEVKELAQAGERIAAIELLMERTGVGLWDAEQAVDQFLESDAREDVPAEQQDKKVSDLVRDLASQGLLIQAIKVHRDETGLGLKESKEIVEQLPRSLVIPAKNIRGVLVTAIIAAFLLVLGMAMAVFFLQS